MEFLVLGPLQIVRDERVLPPLSNKPRALLAVLLLHRGEAVTLERLADELWGESPPATAVKSIQVYVSQLRKALGEGAIETRGRGYALLIGPEQVDAVRFERMLAQGVEHLAGGRAQEAAAVLAEALALWRGPPLADFAYEPWAQAEIARLEDLRLAALEERIDADLALGRPGTLIAELQGLVDRHPTRERLCGQLMLALYRSGRQTEALSVYRKRRQTMVDELGIEPSPELRELEAAMLRQDPDLQSPARLSAPLMRKRRRGGVLIAIGGAGLLLAGAAAVAVTLIRESDTPNAIKPLPTSFCSPVDYQPGTRPRYLIVSDQELHGPNRVLGNQIATAVEFVLRENRFMAGARAVAYQACDSEVAGCTPAAMRYAAHPAVLGVVGPLGSGCAKEIIPIANRVRPGPLAVVSASNTEVGLTRGGVGAAPDEPERYYPTGVRNYVRAVAADDFQGAANAMLAQRLGVRRMFVLVGDDDASAATAEAFRIAAEKLALRVVGSADWLAASDYGALARQIERQRAEGVFLAGALAQDGARLVKALRAVLGRDVHLLAPDGFSVPDLVAEVGPASEGMTISVPGVDPQAVRGSGRRLMNRLRDALGEPHPYTVSAAQATQLLLDAIGRSDGTRRSVTSELFASEVRRGVLGSFDVTPAGDITANRVTIYRIEGAARRLDRVLTPPLSLLVPK